MTIITLPRSRPTFQNTVVISCYGNLPASLLSHETGLRVPAVFLPLVLVVFSFSVGCLLDCGCGDWLLDSPVPAWQHALIWMFFVVLFDCVFVCLCLHPLQCCLPGWILWCRYLCKYFLVWHRMRQPSPTSYYICFGQRCPSINILPLWPAVWVSLWTSENIHSVDWIIIFFNLICHCENWFKFVFV